ncbi:MAG TPA: hypothetical protein VN812_10985 [Candidatus Acidoferrales bacterium]|nr:hypothetical protein [Candidatus Acidoferrales bacterium]
MRIKSRAGNFNMTISEVGTENGELVLTGKMGVWQAKTYLSAEELQMMLGELKISANVVDFVALFGFRYLRNLIEGQTAAAIAPLEEKK